MPSAYPFSIAKVAISILISIYVYINIWWLKYDLCQEIITIFNLKKYEQLITINDT